MKVLDAVRTFLAIANLPVKRGDSLFSTLILVRDVGIRGFPRQVVFTMLEFMMIFLFFPLLFYAQEILFCWVFCVRLSASEEGSRTRKRVAVLTGRMTGSTLMAVDRASADIRVHWASDVGRVIKIGPRSGAGVRTPDWPAYGHAYSPCGGAGLGQAPHQPCTGSRAPMAPSRQRTATGPEHRIAGIPSRQQSTEGHQYGHGCNRILALRATLMKPIVTRPWPTKNRAAPPGVPMFTMGLQLAAIAAMDLIYWINRVIMNGFCNLCSDKE